jgi:hypothetical protein
MGAKGEQIFNCCQCLNGPMIVDNHPACPECFHVRCGDCYFDSTSLEWDEIYIPEMPAQKATDPTSAKAKELSPFAWSDTDATSVKPKGLDPDTLSEVSKEHTTSKAERKDQGGFEDNNSNDTSSIVAEKAIGSKSSILSLEKVHTVVSALTGHTSLSLGFPTRDCDQESWQQTEKTQNLLHGPENVTGKILDQNEHSDGKSWYPNDSPKPISQEAKSEDISDSQTIKAESDDDSELGPIDTPERTESETEDSEETLCDSEPEINEDESSTRPEIVIKQQLVDAFVLQFSKWLNDYLRRRPGGSQPTNSQATTNAELERHSSVGVNVNVSLRRKRQSNRRPSGYGSADDEDETPGKKRPKGNGPTPLDGSEGRRLACPFYKRRPNKYRTWRTCVVPGWLTVHRIK